MTGLPYWERGPLADIHPELPRPYYRIHAQDYPSIFPEEWDQNDAARMRQAARLWEQVAEGAKPFDSLTTLEQRRMLADFRWVLSKLLPTCPDYVLGGLSVQEIHEIVTAWTSFSIEYAALRRSFDVTAESMRPESPMAVVTAQRTAHETEN